jgi:hypothetical protein
MCNVNASAHMLPFEFLQRCKVCTRMHPNPLFYGLQLLPHHRLVSQRIAQCGTCFLAGSRRPLATVGFAPPSHLSRVTFLLPGVPHTLRAANPCRLTLTGGKSVGNTPLP